VNFYETADSAEPTRACWKLPTVSTDSTDVIYTLRILPILPDLLPIYLRFIFLFSPVLLMPELKVLVLIVLMQKASDAVEYRHLSGSTTKKAFTLSLCVI